MSPSRDVNEPAKRMFPQSLRYAWSGDFDELLNDSETDFDPSSQEGNSVKLRLLVTIEDLNHERATESFTFG